MATAAESYEPFSFITQTYNITVPPKPEITSQAAYEFHAGMLATDNSTFIKSTIAYGCEIGAKSACFPPFLDRYIFYVSIINTATGTRQQVPAKGWQVTPGSTYNITLSQTGRCLFYLAKSLTITASNGTANFSARVCGGWGKNYNVIAAGLLEEHNVTSCAELPPTNSITQSGITVKGNPPENWMQLAITPPFDCNYALAFEGNNVSISWISGSG